MERVSLTVDLRKDLGSRSARRSRREGKLPGVLYGHGSEGVAIEVNLRELRRLVGGKLAHTVILELKGPKEVEGKTALVKEVQRDPVTDAPIHADFIELVAGQKLHVTVPIHVVGKAAGIVHGGIVEQTLRELPIEVLPKDIPSALEIDISELNIGQSIHVKQMKLPEGVRSMIDTETSVVAVVAPRAEAAATPAAEGAAAAGAKPEGQS